MKSVHGLSCLDMPDLVNAMVILYPDIDGPWLDFHASTYGLDGLNSQMPILGAQGLEIDAGGTAPRLERTMNLIMTKVIDTAKA